MLKNRKYKIFALVGLIVLSVALHGVTAGPGSSELTKDQAIAIAKNFLSEKDVSVPTHIKVNETKSKLMASPLRDLKTWDIFWGKGEIYVGVHSTTGEVVNYFNGLVPVTSEVRLTSEKAKAIAETFVKPPADAKFTGATLRDHGSFKDYAVVWHRDFNGYKSENLYGDRIVAFLNPITGEVIGYGKSWVMQPPATLEAKLSKERAVNLAKQSLGNRLPANAYVASAELRVVRPNHYWTGQEELSTNSKLAWVIRFEYTREQVHFKEAWIDAETGENLGGYKCSAG